MPLLESFKYVRVHPSLQQNRCLSGIFLQATCSNWSQISQLPCLSKLSFYHWILFFHKRKHKLWLLRRLSRVSLCPRNTFSIVILYLLLLFLFVTFATDPYYAVYSPLGMTLLTGLIPVRTLVSLHKRKNFSSSLLSTCFFFCIVSFNYLTNATDSTVLRATRLSKTYLKVSPHHSMRLSKTPRDTMFRTTLVIIRRWKLLMKISVLPLCSFNIWCIVPSAPSMHLCIPWCWIALHIVLCAFTSAGICWKISDVQQDATI
jgi:hypothetical protein